MVERHYGADSVVAPRGYAQGKNNEISWASRVDVPLQFLLPPRP